jgi:hypothetical protein
MFNMKSLRYDKPRLMAYEDAQKMSNDWIVNFLNELNRQERSRFSYKYWYVVPLCQLLTVACCVGICLLYFYGHK